MYTDELVAQYSYQKVASAKEMQRLKAFSSDNLRSVPTPDAPEVDDADGATVCTVTKLADGCC